ncbi:hypothetical protein DdX_11034 [Ditylenchus destructor]|uniref:Uncharacterized protein n=1 Tax=Ditylenchus destructor TaxID=166010 RepID=A0AAD4R539_9BILA|nr:hypothetical protein DdX_11034 [Ditylenchus destructor]
MNWSVNCSGQVTNALNKYNKKVSELYCGDFSNLFTALPHQDIINNIMEMVKNTFDGNSRMNIQCRYLLTIIMCDGRKANYGQSSEFCYNNLDGAAYG